MPILAKDIDISPSDLLWSNSPADRWFALYTKPRQEKVLLRRLYTADKNFCGLLMPNRSRMPAGRIKTSHLPLFPGYVFLCGTEEDRYDAVCTGCVTQVLDVHDSESLVHDLRNLHHAIESGQPLTRVERMQPGQNVKVVAGPLRGHSGVLLKGKGKSKLILKLSFIQQGAMVEIDDAVVEPA